jgi:hypothetical protein
VGLGPRQLAPPSRLWVGQSLLVLEWIRKAAQWNSAYLFPDRPASDLSRDRKEYPRYQDAAVAGWAHICRGAAGVTRSLI